MNDHSKNPINDDDEVVRVINVYMVKLLDYSTRSYDDKMIIARSEDEAIRTVESVFDGRLKVGGVILLGQAMERLL